MTHADIDEDYLRALVIQPGGRLRLPRVSFAAHFDSLVRGRRGMARPRVELAPAAGELVPACVQHSVLHPEGNKQLLTLLPLPRRR